jgi:wyosine [tRNA(Phe)-imidazoG37] synthetase (radical SAM superfamily)
VSEAKHPSRADVPTGTSGGGGLARAFANHSRSWRDFDYVYPVISRRSRGLSIGVNLNPDTACNFDCIYCLVDRTQPPRRRDVDLIQLRAELDQMLSLAASGQIWQQEPFAGIDARYRRINDIAFSGDGEPTAYSKFAEAVAIARDLRAAHHLPDVKLVLITNATLLDRPRVQQGLALLDPGHDEIWAKLDAGTQEYYQLVDRSKIPLSTVLSMIRALGRKRPLVIQSLFMKVRGEPTPQDEFTAYLDRLAELVEAGAKLKLVQLYTIARRTTEPYATPLEDSQLDELTQAFRRRFPSLNVEVYYGVG